MSWNRTTPLAWRLPVFLLALVLVAGVIGYAEHVAWRQGRFALETLHSANPERFNLARTLEKKVLEMNATLLRFQSGGSAFDRLAFKDDAQEGVQLIATNKGCLSPPENLLVEKLELAFTTYTNGLASLLKRKSLRDFREQDVRQEIAARAAEVLDLCRKFREVQQAAFSQFVSESERRAKELQGLLLVWSLLLPAGGIAFVAVIFQKTVGPLRRKLEQSKVTIARQEKLASLGVFAAGVAHEIRNPLMAMKLHLFSLAKHLPANSPGQEKVSILGNEVNRLEGIVKGFLQFARPADPLLSHIRTDELLLGTTELLRAKCESMDVQLLMESNPPLTIGADAGQIKQVLINLVNNAIESIQGHGIVTVRASEAHEVLRGQRVPVVLLEVTDSGKGISKEVQARLFDPFFTTKPEGTGLGLSVAMRIIEKHGGTIRYVTEPDKGTTFTVVLPKSLS